MSTGNELSGVVDGPAVQAGSVYGGVHVAVSGGSGVARPPVPAQLRAAAAVVDRGEELVELNWYLEGDGQVGWPLVVAITGPGGVGKTALALRGAHQVRGRFPGGQLFADLRGAARVGSLSAERVLAGWLRALGVAPDYLPVDLEEMAALFRTLTARRRVLVVCDNAASSEQIRPLLPNHGGCLVVVTSRSQLVGLVVDGARRIELGPLPETAAVQLLEQIAGAERIAAEPDAARALVARCGRLPLAVRTAAALLTADQHRRLGALVGQLTTAVRDRVGAADSATTTSDLGKDTMAEMANTAALDAAYQGLAEPTRRMYRLLAVHPNTVNGFGIAAAAAIADTEPGHVRQLLDLLVQARLLKIDEHEGGGWAFDNVTHEHATGMLQAYEPEDSHLAAFYRLTDVLLAQASEAALTASDRWWLGSKLTNPAQLPTGRFASKRAALDYLEAQADTLLAVIGRSCQLERWGCAWDLHEAMWPLFTVRKLYPIWDEAQQLALQAAQALNDRVLEARTLVGIATYHNHRQEYHAGYEYAARALTMFRHAAFWLGAGSALEALGTAELGRGHLDRAREHFTASREIHVELGRDRGAVLMVRHLAEVAMAAGDHTAAVGLLGEVLEWYGQRNEPYLTARALTALGECHRRLGQLGPAETALRRSLALVTAVGARQEEAHVNEALARLLIDGGDVATAHTHLAWAHQLYTDLGAPQAAQVAEQLTQLT